MQPPRIEKGRVSEAQLRDLSSLAGQVVEDFVDDLLEDLARGRGSWLAVGALRNV